MTQASESQLIAKQIVVKGWGFIGHPTADGRHWEGRRVAPSGWLEVWRTADPDFIALYADGDVERRADEEYAIDWTHQAVGA